MRSAKKQQAGFTLIEVMVALLILASASSVLMGMQGAAISRTIRDKTAQQAMLVARRIMSSIESAGDQAPLDSFEDQSALTTLQNFGAPDPADEEMKKTLSQLRVALTVQEWPLPLPNVDEDPMKKITLRVSWGTTIDDSFIITYLMPIQKPTP